MQSYPATFRDRYGREDTTLTYDDGHLALTLRGIDFEGHAFDSLEGKRIDGLFEYNEPCPSIAPGLGELYDFTIVFELPILVARDDGVLSRESLRAEVDMRRGGAPTAIQFALLSPEGETWSTAPSDFENGLVDIQRQLPSGHRLTCCLSCRYSHYNPFGNSEFGQLYCFRSVKDQTDEIRDKSSLLRVWDGSDATDPTFAVPESYHCDEHAFVEPEDWNYSNWKAEED